MLANDGLTEVVFAASFTISSSGSCISAQDERLDSVNESADCVVAAGLGGIIVLIALVLDSSSLLAGFLFPFAALSSSSAEELRQSVLSSSERSSGETGSTASCFGTEVSSSSSSSSLSSSSFLFSALGSSFSATETETGSTGFADVAFALAAALVFLAFFRSAALLERSCSVSSSRSRFSASSCDRSSSASRSSSAPRRPQETGAFTESGLLLGSSFTAERAAGFCDLLALDAFGVAVDGFLLSTSF
mmetsp:Transcript_25331/g.45847  ORF Transcript_25331/g.45847 Transcript_25331/m.45847 type:complete len:248 (-) Transcript_25331:1109-1852(-)